MSKNHREVINAYDPIAQRTFAVQGTVANGGINVNATASLAGSPIPITGATSAVGVAIVDGSGNQITSFGGGTQYAELVTTAPGTGTLSLGRYKSAAPTLTDGQMYGLQLDSSGNLKVTGSLSVGGTTDNSAYTAGSSTGTPSYGFYHSVIDTVTDGRTAALGMTNKRALFVNLQASGGTEIGTSGAPLRVDPTGTTAQPVTNTGTFAVQATLSAETTKVIGTVNQGTSPWVVSGTVTTTPPSNASTNIAQINGVTPLMGNGVTGTGSLRVTVASDNTAFSVNAVQSGTWNISNISGTISLPTGAATETTLAKLTQTQGSTTSGQSGPLIQGAVTTGAPTYSTAQTSPLSLDTAGNLRTTTTLGAGSAVIGHVITDSGSTTAVTGNVTVTQATGTNLHTVVDSGTLTAVTAITNALPAGTNLLGKVGIDQTTPGTTNAISLAQIGATTVSSGNGVAGAGVQRVTIASDNTAFSVNAVQSTAAALTAGWVVINGEQNDTTGTFTNATQTTSVTATNLAGYGNVLISINGTYGTATAVFEGSDDGGTTFYPISEAARTDSNTIESGYTSLTNTSRAWQVNNPGWDSLRVRSSAVASGTVNVRISPSAAPSAAGATVAIGVALPAGTNVIGHIITDTGSTTAVTGTVAVTESGTWNVGASSATGSSVPANAFFNGLLAQTGNPSAATPGNLVGALADKLGKQVVVGSIRDLKVQQQTTITSSTAETTVLTSVASTFLDVYGVIVVNSSATATNVTFKDATAGTTRFNIYVPAGDTRGFMLPESGAHNQAVVANNWTATCGTSVASILITMLAVKNI